MGSRMRACERRDIVLHAAVDAFARGGYFDTTMVEIADRAEVSQPYVQRLFGTKRDLYLSALGLALDDISEALASALESGELDQSPIPTVLAAHARLLKETRSLHLIAQGVATPTVPGVRELLMAHARDLRSRLQRTGVDDEQLDHLIGDILRRTVCEFFLASNQPRRHRDELHQADGGVELG